MKELVTHYLQSYRDLQEQNKTAIQQIAALKIPPKASSWEGLEKKYNMQISTSYKTINNKKNNNN